MYLLIFLLSGVIMIMKINRAYQFRLYPTKVQEVLIHKTFGCTRFVYNYCLDLKRNNKYLTKFDLIKELPGLKKDYSFLKEVDSCSLQNAITDLMVGFGLFEKRLYAIIFSVIAY